MKHQPERIARFIASLVAVVALVGLAPLGLLAISRRRFGSSNPLTRIPWPWQWSLGDAADAVRSPLTDDVVVNLVVRSTLIVVWVSIAIIAVTTALEVAHLVRHRGMAMPSIRGLGWAQPFSRALATGLLVLVPLTSPRASLAVDERPATERAIVDTDGDDRAQRREASLGETNAIASFVRAHHHPTHAPSLHIVQRGESVYGIAEALASNVSMTTPTIADRILDVNLGNAMVGGQHFTNPAYIEVGWELVIPADVLPVERSKPSATQVPPSPAPAEASNPVAVRHTVVAGDTLADIADQYLGDADVWPLVFHANAGREMGDGRTFTDPHLIVPGWTIDIPQVETGSDVSDRAEEQSELADHPDAYIDRDSPPVELGPESAETPTDDAPDRTVAPSSADTHAESPGPSSTPTVPAIAPSTTTTTLPVPLADNPLPAATDVPSAPSAPAPIRVEHAALLAAGVLALVGVRRRQRLRSAPPRARVPEPPAAVMATERRLRTVDPGERSTRVDVAIRAVAHELIDTDAQIGLVLLSPDGDIELRLTDAAHLAPPWHPVGDTEQTWQLPASVPVELLGEAARRVGTPCVALVQLGMAGDRDVLIDVEACGTLAVSATAEQAKHVVTAISAGLATSPYAEIAHLITVALADAAVLGHRNAHHAESVTAAIDLAGTLVGRVRPDDRTTFSLRSLRTGGEMWEPAVVLVSTAERRDLPRPLPLAGRGIALVVATRLDPEVDAEIDAPARLLARRDGWTLAAFGQELKLTPVGVTAADLADVADMIEDATGPLLIDEPGATDDQTEVFVEAVSDTVDPGDADTRDDVFEPRLHHIVVRLMGGVEVVSSDGKLGSFERSKTVELIAWLATHRTSSTRTAARTALWELDVRDATFANVVSEARRALGRLVAPSGDDEWVARTLTERLPLHEGVVTDAQLMEDRLHAARLQAPDHAVETLRPAAEMIRDMPFAGTSYLWPDSEGITSNLVLLATGVAAELAAHALSLGDIDLVFWATGRGLQVLAGHEELIGLRMRAHARAGDLAGVRQEWESYERVIVADAWSDGEPAPKLLALRRELLTAPT